MAIRHKKEIYKRYNLDKNKTYTIKELSNISGVSVADLQEVEKRGAGAWVTSIDSVRMKGTYKKNVKAPRSQKLSQSQWARARLFAFINKLDRIKEGKQKYMNQDCDIARKYYDKFKCSIN